MVLKKSKSSNDVLFIDASAEFIRSGNKNKITEENRQKILESFTSRENIDHFAHMISNEQIAANDYNLAVSSYVEQEDTREVIDITKLNERIEQIVARQSELRTEIDVIVADLEGAR